MTKKDMLANECEKKGKRETLRKDDRDTLGKEWLAKHLKEKGLDNARARETGEEEKTERESKRERRREEGLGRENE